MHSGAVTLEKGSQTSCPQGSEAPEGRAKWLSPLRKSLQHLGIPIESHGHGTSLQQNSADGGCSALKRLLANRERCAAAVSDDVWRAERGPWTACVSSIASSLARCLCLCCKRLAMRVAIERRAWSGQTQSTSNAARALQTTPFALPQTAWNKATQSRQTPSKEHDF